LCINICVCVLINQYSTGLLSVTPLKKNPIAQNWWQRWDPCPLTSPRKILLAKAETHAHLKRKAKTFRNATPSYHIRREEKERPDTRW
jgi:hypothetical protein